MKLLILTQKIDINDDVLGFFYGWVAEFAKHCEQVTVVCLYQGEYDLPSNVKVLSLGKEESASVPLIRGNKGVKKLQFLFRFYKYIWQERKNYDSVFVHMNQVYVVLGGLFWKVWGKRVSLWYAHGHVPFGLRVSEKLVDIIFTSTKSGCRLASEKIKIVGQGIDTNIFKPLENRIENEVFKILTVGRISPVKDIETLIEAVNIINSDAELSRVNFEVDIIGGAESSKQNDYLCKLKKIVKEKNLEKIVNFVGPVPSHRVAEYLNRANFFVNTSRTGSLDKVILEAMSCKVIIASCNESLFDVLGKYKNELMFKEGDYLGLAEVIKKIVKMDKIKIEEIEQELRDIVVNDHSLDVLIKKILA